MMCISLQSTGFTAVMFACKNGHLDTVMTLMRHGANPHIKNRVCHTRTTSQETLCDINTMYRRV